MAAVYLIVVVRGARRHGASLRPDAAGIRASAQAGAPLLVRTLSLRAVLMIATAVAARLGDADVAAHQIILSLWSLLAFALDAIAIAGQAIIGRYLGANDTKGAREACRRMVEWGIAIGVVLGLLVIVSRPLFLPLFTSDAMVKDTAVAGPARGRAVATDLRDRLRPRRRADGRGRRPLPGLGDAGHARRRSHRSLCSCPALGGGLTALWGAMTLMMTVRHADSVAASPFRPLDGHGRHALRVRRAPSASYCPAPRPLFHVKHRPDSCCFT